jgi:hypothetical protein
VTIESKFPGSRPSCVQIFIQHPNKINIFRNCLLGVSIMGASESAEERFEREAEERERLVFDPLLISWDEDGNLRYGAFFVYIF